MLSSNFCTTGFGACTKGENHVRRCDPLAVEKTNFVVRGCCAVVEMLFRARPEVWRKVN